MKITTLIIDGDGAARQRLREFLQADADLHIMDDCADGMTAARMIEELAPQVIFLALETPQATAFEALRQLDNPPVVVLMTAQPEDAVKAPEAENLEYLLKPLRRARLLETLARAKELSTIRHGREERFLAALAEVTRRQRGCDVFPIKSNGRFIFLRPQEIQWVQAERDYVRFHAGKASHLVRGTMTHVQEKLDPEQFARIHRSTIVNLRYVRETQPLLGGDYAVVMRDGTQLTLSRGQRAVLARLLPSHQAQ